MSQGIKHGEVIKIERGILFVNADKMRNKTRDLFTLHMIAVRLDCHTMCILQEGELLDDFQKAHGITADSEPVFPKGRE